MISSTIKRITIKYASILHKCAIEM